MAMKILIACEFSGTVRNAFIAKGHDAISCDLLPPERGPPHHQGDVLELLDQGFDLMIAHPPCTYLSTSGLHWNCRTKGRYLETRKAIQFVEKLWSASIPRIVVENPVGCLPTHSALMKATQIIQPYNFGEDASKDTCLWLKGLLPLRPTRYIEPRMVNGKPRWANQTDSGQNKLTPSETRAMERSRTFQGIADAMAEQWG
jgi:hypothetical protein